MSPEPLRFSFASRCPSLVNERKNARARVRVQKGDLLEMGKRGERFFFLLEEAAGVVMKGEISYSGRLVFSGKKTTCEISNMHARYRKRRRNKNIRRH